MNERPREEFEKQGVQHQSGLDSNAKSETSHDRLLEQLIDGTLVSDHGSPIMARITEHVRSLVFVPPFGAGAVRELISVILAERFDASLGGGINRDHLLDWLTEKMIAIPSVEQRLREIWGSVCRRILEAKS